MPWYTSPFVIGAGVSALKGVAGVGIGLGSSKLFGGGYDTRDGILDFGLGALTLPGSGILSKSERLAPVLKGGSVYNTKFIGNGLDVVRKGRYYLSPMLAKNHGQNLNTFFADAGAGVAAPVQPAPAAQIANGGITMSDGTFTPITVNPVQINYTPGQAPKFNKTLKDFIADKQLQGLVNQQIFQMNSPLLDANKQTKINRDRKVAQAQQIGASLQKHYDRVIAEDAAANAQEKQLDEARAAKLKAQEAAALETVPVTYNEGEAVTAKQQADVAAANEESLANALVDRLAQQGQDYLKRLRDAEASQDRVNVQSINQEAADAIRSNVSQIRANQAQRGNLLGSLASEQYKNAIDLYNTAINQYNESESRKYDQAARQAQMEYDAQVANAQFQANQVAAAAKAVDDVEPSDDMKAARKRLDKMNDAISKLKTEEPNKQQQPGDWDEWSRKLRLMRAERDRIKNKFFPEQPPLFTRGTVTINGRPVQGPMLTGIFNYQNS